MVFILDDTCIFSTSTVSALQWTRSSGSVNGELSRPLILSGLQVITYDRFGSRRHDIQVILHQGLKMLLISEWEGSSFGPLLTGLVGSIIPGNLGA